MCDRVQISQVLLNLLNNSFYAVKKIDEKWITLDIIKEAKVWIFKVTDSGKEIEFGGRGRHDPCVLPRAVPMVESMVAIVLLDHALRHNAQNNFLD